MAYLAVGVVLYLALCWVLAKGYVSPPKRSVQPPNPSISRAEVAISPTSGSKAYRIPTWVSAGLAEGSPTHETVVVLAHGLGGGPDAYWPLAEALIANHEVAVPALRGQTESPVRTVGFGPGEAEEIVAVVEWVRSRYPKSSPPRVLLYGVSMGGAASWIAASKRPELVAAVVTEGAYSNLETATNEFLSSNLPFGHILFRPVVGFASKMTGLRPDQVRPVESAQQWNGRPALVIHAESDELFAQHHANELAEASGSDVWIVPGVGHADISQTHTGEIARILGQLADNQPITLPR